MSIKTQDRPVYIVSFSGSNSLSQEFAWLPTLLLAGEARSRRYPVATAMLCVAMYGVLRTVVVLHTSIIND